MAAGGIVAGVGGAVAGTVAGTHIVHKYHTNSLLDRAQKAIDDYSTYKDNAAEAWKKIENMCYAISTKVKSFGVEVILNFVWQIFLNANLKECIGNAKGIAKKLAVIVKYLTINIPLTIGGLTILAVGTCLCGYNLYEAITSAKVIHKKKSHPAAVEIRNKTIIELNTEVEKLEKVKTSLENRCTS